MIRGDRVLKSDGAKLSKSPICLTLFSLAASIGPQAATAQITLDNFTPAVPGDDSALTANADNTIEITESMGRRRGDGTNAGPNLFHSFAQFGIAADQMALFTQNINDGSDPISNVIARVSGGETSILDGVLRSSIEGADFWLVNPAGVMFGAEASIDVGGIQGGSFNAGASDFIVFANGDQLGTSSSGVELSVSNPVGFGFLDEGGAMGQLSLNGTQLSGAAANASRMNGLSLSGHSLSLDSDAALATQTGTAMAGDIRLHAADVLTVQGSITTLDGVVRDNPEVNTGGSIFLEGSEVALSGAQITSLIDGRALDAGVIDVSASGDITATDAQLLSYSRRGRNGGSAEIRLTAGDSIVLDNSVLAAATNGNQAIAEGTGDITLSAGEQLALENSAVLTRTTGNTQAGTIRLQGRNVTIEGAREASLDESLFRESGLVLGQGVQSSSGPEAETNDPNSRVTGNAGDVSISGDSVELTKGAQVSSATFAFGNAGDVSIEAKDLISIRGVSATDDNAAILSAVSSFSEFRDPDFDPEIGEARGGASGNVDLRSDGVIELVDGELSVKTRSHNPDNTGASLLNITADAITLTRSELTSITRASNDAGSINIEARTIDLDESDILSFTGGGGNAGSIAIAATERLSANSSAGDDTLPTRIAAESRRTRNAGAAGRVRLSSDQDIFLTDTQIAVSTFSREQVVDSDDNPIIGEIEIQAGNRLEFIDSGAVASTRGNSDAGDVSLRAPEIMIAGSARVSEVSSAPRFLGAGIESSTRRAGNSGFVRIIGDDIEIQNGLIQTNANAFNDNEENPQTIADSDSVSGAAGNIVVRGDNIAISEASQITSNANSLGDAGSITINGSDSVSISGGQTVVGSESTYRVDDDIRGGASGDVRILSTGEIAIDDASIRVRTRSRNPDNTERSIILVRSTEGDVLLDGALLNAISQGSSPGGQLRLIAENVELSDTDLLAIAANQGNGGSITIRATENITANLDGDEDALTRIAAESLRTRNAGAAGTVDIEAGGDVRLNQTTLSSATFSNTQVTDENDNPLIGTISVSAGNALVLTDSGAAVTTGGAGAAGNIRFRAPNIELRGQRDVIETGGRARFLGRGYESSTTGSGAAGNLAINGDTLVIAGTSIASSSRLEPDQESPGATLGDAGNVLIAGRVVQVTDGAEISALANSFGDAGSVSIVASETIEVRDSEVSSASTYRNDEDRDDPRGGSAGNVVLQAQDSIRLVDAKLNIASRSRNPDITTSPELQINANEGTIFSERSAIEAETTGLNPGGKVNLDAGDITLNGSRISAITALSGDGGSININALRTITANQSAQNSEDGSITEISAESLRVGNAGAPGQIAITAGEDALLRNTAIATTVFSNTLLDSFGTIDITAGRSIQLVDSGAAVSTQGNSNAGDIFIGAPEILIQGARPVFTNRGNFDDPIGNGIEASTTGRGRGGNIHIEGDNVVLSGATLNNTSRFRDPRPETSARGDAGDIVVIGRTVTVSDDTTISTEANALGNAGSVKIEGTQALQISGDGTIISSESLFRDPDNAVGGAAGQVALTSNGQISISGAELSVRTRSNNPNNRASGSLTVESTNGDIHLSSASLISDTNGSNQGGSIFITGEDINLNDSSISAYTSNRGNGGSIEIRARGDVVANTTGDGQTRIGAGSRRTNNAGAVGNVVIHADQNLLLNNTQLASSSFAVDKRFEIEGDDTSPEITGSMRLSAGNRVELIDAAVVTTTQRNASAGDINISGRSILIKGSADASEIRGLSRPLGSGITASANSVRDGDAGSVIVAADDGVVLDNTSLTATSGRDGRGNGNAGSILLSGRTLNVQGETEVSVQANGFGDAGNIDLNFEDGIVVEGDSIVKASTTSRGDAGSISLDAPVISLTNGEVASTSAFAEDRPDETIGRAGNITVVANQLNLANSRISSSTAGNGDGGDLSLTTAANTQLLGGSRIETQAQGSGNSGSINLNVAGDLVLQTEGATQLEQLSSILTNSQLSDGGSISATVDGTLQLDNGRIVSSVAQAGGTGGNVSVSAGSLLLESGQILAQAAAGNGGAITINRLDAGVNAGGGQGGGNAGGSGGLFLIDANSLINADSEAGVDGAVDVSQPDTNANLVVVAQDVRIENPPEFSDDVCGRAQRSDTAQNTLVVQTRESISPAPDTYQAGLVIPGESSAPADTIASAGCALSAAGD